MITNSMIDFVYVLVFIVVAALFAITPMIVSYFIAPRTKGAQDIRHL